MKVSVFRHLSQDHRGLAAVEMAIIAPVLIFMALGAFDFGMAYSLDTTYLGAIRAGCEYGMTSTDTAEIAKRVKVNLDTTTLDTTKSPNPNVTVVYECENNPGVAVTSTTTCGGTVTTPYQYVSIELWGKYNTAFSWPFLTGNFVPIHEQGRMQVK